MSYRNLQHQIYLSLLTNKEDNLEEFWHQIIQKHEHFILNHLLKYIYWARFSEFIKLCLWETRNKQTHKVVLYFSSGPGSRGCLHAGAKSTNLTIVIRWSTFYDIMNSVSYGHNKLWRCQTNEITHKCIY